MKLGSYIKDCIISILAYLVNIVLVVLILNASKLDISIIIFTIIILLVNGLIILLNNYYRKKKFYDAFLNNLSVLSKKFLILETIPEANTYEEKIMVEALYEINKSMIENINEYKNNINEFKEYLEMWIHEVKIPISSMALKCHNNKKLYDKSFLTLIRRLDNNIDAILYYVRSENTEKDFIINDIDLKELIRNIGIKNKDDILENNVTFETDIRALRLNSDKKWLEFIINQIINNSIKYKKDDDSIIRISSYEDKDKVVIEIYDNGVGIPKEDIPRVFDKSFTGTNGRNKVKSTGMGLYIIKKLCDKLGHKISIQSELNKYTKVTIEFGKNDIYKI